MSTKLTIAALDRFLSAEKPDADLTAYLGAAAVLSTFDPFDLNPVSEDAESKPREALLSDLLPMCEPFNNGKDPGLWTLSLLQRRDALKALGTRKQIKKALAANPERQQTVVQKMFERIVEGNALELDQLSREELAALLEVLEWVEDILDGLPKKNEVSAALVRSDLLSPMERLAGSNFVGRKQELAQLKDYVLGPKPDAPLFVFGTGGVGKSTLLARFILAHAVPQNVAIAYVDVDRATIRPDQPLTVLLDFITQLYPQLNIAPAMADSLVKEITFAISRHEGARYLESFGSDDVPEYLLDLTANNLDEWLGARTALLMVDTVEEAQFLGADVMWPFVRLLVALSGSIKQLRVILSGRSLPVEYMDQAFPGIIHGDKSVEDPSFLDLIPFPNRPLNLTELDPEAARDLLRSTLPQEASSSLSENDFNDVIALVGRNPMCLKLAGRLLVDVGVEKLRSERSEMFARLKAEKIQALLYGRILRHLHNDEVRKVAYPGLIVRRIDANVIREVLAAPCKLQLDSDHNEYDIFNELSREKALMFTDPVDQSLRHRADVRRSMLEDLSDHIEPEVIKEIDSNAVSFYSQLEGEVARAEEIYHRLRLREDESVLESRWIPEAAKYLHGALSEVPPQQRLWLAEQLHVSLDHSVRQEASQDAWENQAARSADRYLRSRLPEEALKVLHERRTRLPRSPLYALETETYRFLGQHDEALAVARKGVESASKAGAIDMALELLLKMVVIEEGRGNLEDAQKLLNEAIAVSAHTSDDLLRLRVQVTGVRLQRQLNPAARDERTALKSRALKMLDEEMLRKLRDFPVLLREVAAELTKQSPQIAAAALETLGVEVITDAQAEAFGRAVTNKQTRDTFKKFSLKDASDVEDIRRWATKELTTRDTRRLSGALASAEAGSVLLKDFRDYFRAGVSSALKGKL